MHSTQLNTHNYQMTLFAYTVAYIAVFWNVPLNPCIWEELSCSVPSVVTYVLNVNSVY